MEQAFRRLRELRQALVLLFDLLEGKQGRQREHHTSAAFQRVQAGFDALGDPQLLAAEIEESARPRLLAEIAELDRLRTLIVNRITLEKAAVEASLERVREARLMVVARMHETLSGERVDVAG